MMACTLKQSRAWSVLVALLMAAQLALALHSLEHKFDPGLPLGDDCALCQVASVMAPGPASEPVVTPRLYVFVRADIVVTPVFLAWTSPAGFRSRAPPVTVSL